MGKRANFEIVSDEGDVGVVLFANNSHEDVDPDTLFMDAWTWHRSTSEVVAALLHEQYPSSKGNHRRGEPIFTIDLEPGDREYVLRAKVGSTIQGVPLQKPTFERNNADGTVEIINSVSLEKVPSETQRPSIS